MIGFHMDPGQLNKALNNAPEHRWFIMCCIVLCVRIMSDCRLLSCCYVLIASDNGFQRKHRFNYVDILISVDSVSIMGKLWW